MPRSDFFSAPEHLPPPLKKIIKPQEEIDQYAVRLSTPRKQHEPNDAHLLAPHVTKPKEELDKSVNRLYTQAMERERRRKEKIAEREQQEALGPSANTKKLEEEEIVDSVNRLYTQSLTVRKAELEKLREKFLFHPKTSPRSMTVEECNARVYTAAVERHKAKMEKTFNVYVSGTMKSPRGPLSKEELAASALRLSTTTKPVSPR